MDNSWFKEISVYQIWCRSFKDGNGDGIGDLYGVLEKLDYIKSLGVDAIWFSPIYPSPNADYGYDISDYTDINKEFGDLDIFKKVLNEAHKRDIKVIMDLVVNHTSDEHRWFKESSRSKDNPYRDYYIWRKGRTGGRRPNNWLSVFEGNAWEYSPETDEYYLHIFAKKQPDLNMDNPKVREEVKNIMRFWLDMGVDGFREDVITFISKKEGLPNGFPLPVATGIEHYRKGPHIHEYLREFRRDVINKYDCFVVGESPMTSWRDAVEFTSGEDRELDMMISFDHMSADCFIVDTLVLPFSLRKLKRVMGHWQHILHGKGWNALYIENHDHPRIISRYGSEKYRTESGKSLATMCFMQSGTPFIYQGQEIGMTNSSQDSMLNFRDVQTFNTSRVLRQFHIPEKTVLRIINRTSRENARTPVQWSAGKNAGFSDAEPWFPVNPNYTDINVEAQEKDPQSLLNYYRKLLKVRKENPVLIYGDFTEYYHLSGRLFCYSRSYKGKRALVICSFSESKLRFKTPKGFDLHEGELVLSSLPEAPLTDSGCVLKPYEARVYLFDFTNTGK
ncbi:MAG: alpha-glucosidase [Oscillospiraceae bacterium]|jgi:oligo-1,6-glucosidase|nr:alpha-glucosidase [Oscillospiraceae bacterium]MBQ5489350.1 alpha-glucosidase [Oscillospiraceae bacterium]